MSNLQMLTVDVDGRWFLGSKSWGQGQWNPWSGFVRIDDHLPISIQAVFAVALASVKDQLWIVTFGNNGAVALLQHPSWWESVTLPAPPNAGSVPLAVSFSALNLAPNSPSWLGLAATFRQEVFDQGGTRNRVRATTSHSGDLHGLA